ncbi:hypothetical protein K0M31_016954 [Melipona bicolor]|uniref:Uncharacterized protein n=1 Tax=Melipona bicolor TaxID=60889 RepID=A0AA40KE94_9HYME|nr:hypothetical protein K0M31_016954 [Melipona bicolor]
MGQASLRPFGWTFVVNQESRNLGIREACACLNTSTLQHTSQVSVCNMQFNEYYNFEEYRNRLNRPQSKNPHIHATTLWAYFRVWLAASFQITSSSERKASLSEKDVVRKDIRRLKKERKKEKNKYQFPRRSQQNTRRWLVKRRAEN